MTLLTHYKKMQQQNCFFIENWKDPQVLPGGAGWVVNEEGIIAFHLCNGMKEKTKEMNQRSEGKAKLDKVFILK